jgi:eukaryotic-like serine/threonine-protein kinase
VLSPHPKGADSLAAAKCHSLKMKAFPLAAMQGEKLTRTVRFGEFELDQESGELYQDGQKIQLHEQPLRILKLLLNNPGELVGRDEIRSLLWPNGTIVEFVNSVNAAVKKLRSALGDSADQPRYIETIKGRGYRLIIPVEHSASSFSAGIGADEFQPDRILVEPEQHRSRQRISHYKVLDRIGAGGMGVVYRAEDIRLGRPVALKFLPDELSSHPAALERLRLEARSISALNHPNICTIYDIGEESGQPFIAMELLEGGTLADRISGSALSFADVLDYASQIVEGLEAAHRKGIVHRDIKPANIFITNHRIAKILDFGLAKATASGLGAKHLTSPGAAVGTVAYMSPEQALNKELDERSDLFSFGLVLYEMATGRLPSRGLPLNGLPAGLERIISKCLENDPELRYQHASEIRADLQRLKLSRDSKISLSRRWKLIASLSAAIVAIFVAAYFYFHRTPKLTDKDTIVLAEFINRTGDPVFEGTLHQGLAIELEQSPFLRIVSDERIQHALQLMAKTPETRLSPELAREVCERTGSAAVLDGSIASLGAHYVIGLRAKNCGTGEVMYEEQAQAAREEEVLNVLSKLARNFRSRVGESFAAIREHDTPLSEATTTSLEALKAYSTGWKVHALNGSMAALPFFRRAIEIDPEFAMAHESVGRMYGDADAPDLSAESIRKAWQLRNRTSDREKFVITTNYDLLVTGNLEKALETNQAWAQSYPNDAWAHAQLSGMANKATGQYEKAEAEAQKAIDLYPDYAIAYYNLAVNNACLNRLQEAEDILHRAIARGLEIDEFFMLRYELAFLKGDRAGMEQTVARARGRPGAEGWICSKEASALAYSGHLQQARSKSRVAVAEAEQAAQRERAGVFAAGAAVHEALFGNASEARKAAMAALNYSNNRDVEYGAAFALAVAGDSPRSDALANDLETRFPEDTLVRFSYLPVLRARVALNRRNPTGALETLQAAASHELGLTWTWFGALYPIYMRGEAYLALHQGAKASAEFQKILDHPGIVLLDSIGALARLQLGRALALTGDMHKANAAYEDFLTLWKEADPDIPVLQQAKAEYAKLR